MRAFCSLFVGLLGLFVTFPPAARAEEAALPAPLAAYAKDGRFDPGDFSWMAGRFSPPGSEAARNWEAIENYRDRCMTDAREVVREQLAAMGVSATDLRPGPYGDALCSQVVGAMSVEIGTADDYAALPKRLEQARQLWDFARGGMRIGISVTVQGNPDARKEDRWLPISATFGEQFARKALSWAQDDRNPPIPAELQPYFRYLVLEMVAQQDRVNSAWLRSWIAEKGWPTIPAVGEQASSAAWLLVQHADHDPALQLQVLRMIEPLAEKGEVSKADFAYLYDRIMLKLAGKQRYATQFAPCKPGDPVRPVQPTEDSDPARIDALRAEMGLKPLVDYRAQMDRGHKPCGVAAP